MAEQPRILLITVRSDNSGGPAVVASLLHREEHNLSASVAGYVNGIALPREEPLWGIAEQTLGSEALIEIPRRKFSVIALARLFAFARRNSITVIHSHGKGAGIYGRLLALLTGTPCVHHFHGLHLPAGNVGQSLYRKLERVLGWFTHRVIAVSESEAQLIAKARLIAPAKLLVIHNGVELNATNPYAARPETPPRQLTIINVNRFVTQKNPLLLIEVARALKRSDPELDFKIQIIGKADNARDLTHFERALTNSGIGNRFEICGAVPELQCQLRKADIFLSTSLWEGFPLALLEALAEGLPAVVTDVAGNRDVIEQDISGFLFPTDGPQSAALHIKNLTDLRTRKFISNAAFERARLFDRTTFRAKMEALYREVANSRRPLKIFRAGQ